MTAKRRAPRPRYVGAGRSFFGLTGLSAGGLLEGVEGVESPVYLGVHLDHEEG